MKKSKVTKSKRVSPQKQQLDAFRVSHDALQAVPKAHRATVVRALKAAFPEAFE